MSTLRITAGSLRGRRVSVPKGDVRPTSERARQAFFNIIGERIDGARFLDLFAGSGIFSFEALSRGAASATAVDRNTAQITKAAAELGVRVETASGDVLTVLKRMHQPFDLVYADPPYDYDRYDDLVDAIGQTATDNAIVAVEHRRRSNPFIRELGSGNHQLTPWRTAEYGEVWITFFRAEPATGIAIENE